MEKQKGESLGVVIVESGWGSILPTVILASMLNSGPAARSGKLSVGDQIMSINDTSLVGLPLATCQGIIKVRFTFCTVAFFWPFMCKLCYFRALREVSAGRLNQLSAWD